MLSALYVVCSLFLFHAEQVLQSKALALLSSRTSRTKTKAFALSGRHAKKESGVDLLGESDDMRKTVNYDEKGFRLQVGPSRISDGAGNGLFVSLSSKSEAEEMTITGGTPLCQYCGGTWSVEPKGDYTVAYDYSNVNSLVVLNGQVISLMDAIKRTLLKRSLEKMKSSARVLNTSPSVSVGPVPTDEQDKDITDILVGHKTWMDEETGEFMTFADYDGYEERFYVPFMVEEEDNNKDLILEKNLGMYANDLAYRQPYRQPYILSETVDDGDSEKENGGCITEEEYEERSSSMNLLTIAFELEISPDNDTGVYCLHPVRPAILTENSLVLKNRQPKEVGLVYTFRYWAAWEREKGLRV
jgi:hypothetical protein